MSDKPVVYYTTEENNLRGRVEFLEALIARQHAYLMLTGPIEPGSEAHYHIYVANGHSPEEWKNLTIPSMKGDDKVNKKQFELICAEVHNAEWEQSKRVGYHAPHDCFYKPKNNKNKFTKHCTCCHTDMYPYDELPERVKEYDRVTVRAVLAAQARVEKKEMKA